METERIYDGDSRTDKVMGPFIGWHLDQPAKLRLVSIEGHQSAATHLHKNLQHVAVTYLHNLGLKPIPQDNSAGPHRVGVITDFLQNEEAERE